MIRSLGVFKGGEGRSACTVANGASHDGAARMLTCEQEDYGKERTIRRRGVGV